MYGEAGPGDVDDRALVSDPPRQLGRALEGALRADRLVNDRGRWRRESDGAAALGGQADGVAGVGRHASIECTMPPTHTTTSRTTPRLPACCAGSP